MHVADCHGYGSEMRQKAIMVGHSGEKKKGKGNAPLCQNFRTAVITLLHPKQCKVTEILWHVKCQRIKYQDFNVTLFKKTGSINFQLHFQLVKSSRGNREKGASPWHKASHFEVWNKTLFSEAVECTCNRFNLTAAAVSYLRFVWFIFPLGVGAPERDGSALLTFPNLRIDERFTPVRSFSQPATGKGGAFSRHCSHAAGETRSGLIFLAQGLQVGCLGLGHCETARSQKISFYALLF